MLTRVRMHGNQICDRACSCHKSAADILRAAGIALDELPMSVQARLFALASEQNTSTNGAYSLTDPEGADSANPPSGHAEANARYSQHLAALNARNRDFWSRQ
jgi:hypothetical protein